MMFLKYKIPTLCILLSLLQGTIAMAQELNCKVVVQYAAIKNVDKQVFTTLERSITEFMNNRKWTKEDYQINEKIDCNLLLNLTEKTADGDIYKATINISASRPVFNSSYSTPIINYIDREVAFKYSQFTPFQFDDNRVTGTDPMASNLTAILAYYAYLVLAMDMDSFSPEGGEAMLKKAQNVVNNAPEQGQQITGWKAFEDKRNRYWIVDQLLSPRFTSLRSYWYSYHREGLDNMYTKPVESRNKILQGIPSLGQLQRDNPGASILQFFFNAKSDEMLRMLAQATREERKDYIPILSQIDVANSTKYNSLQ